MYDYGSKMRLRRFMSLCSSFSLFAQAPQIPTFRTTTNLVIVNVTVRDKSGKPVDNLTKEDFTLLEDDKPQTISIFELERLTGETLPALTPGPQQIVTSRQPQAASRPSPAASQQPPTSRKDRRLLALFFDF